MPFADLVGVITRAIRQTRISVSGRKWLLGRLRIAPERRTLWAIAARKPSSPGRARCGRERREPAEFAMNASKSIASRRPPGRVLRRVLRRLSTNQPSAASSPVESASSGTAGSSRPASRRRMRPARGRAGPSRIRAGEQRREIRLGPGSGRQRARRTIAPSSGARRPALLVAFTTTARVSRSRGSRAGAHVERPRNAARRAAIPVGRASHEHRRVSAAAAARAGQDAPVSSSRRLRAASSRHGRYGR